MQQLRVIFLWPKIKFKGTRKRSLSSLRGGSLVKHFVVIMLQSYLLETVKEIGMLLFIGD
jgi:hypothetical protein